jgi:hypothetical protein
MHTYALELIGASAWGVGFNGSIDEVRMWDVERTPEEIRSTMTDIVDPGAHPDLIAYYRFDALEDLGVGADGADDVRDYSASANHGDAEGGIELVGGAVPVEDPTWSSIKALFR